MINMSVKKMILIDDEHALWIDKKFINLSKFVRSKISEDMEKEK